ncbi:UDP-N-acetylmuramoyl-L-alanyl-D-glutamate--2,6-diaminopimelate ligase [Halomonas piscis]|uniref:UDP-N-acetylmuramoyl-L-alanyl-D-glutamate--2,6-diaminopimelate ligase n=1 Tax=Halomonas piscis TaxID=3031727 RepID=A0ABY9Z3X4_9GAMM|nr:UDP-N-acetylmuramoyl-L-alanyl-D-glutamate--2,6-diaminopimelate ligase [Halomonas piscis]WNK21425.1 UDP-N-acetylmuramoyl-L-alanyl-D-glutamate--2,6-diaminopimelate ligase [Halomonas piscis]
MTLSASDLVRALEKIWPASDIPYAAQYLPETLGLRTDSRQVAAGEVFVAVPGSSADGRDFVDRALEAGAALVLSHADGGEATLEGRILTLPQLASRLGELGRALFAVPDALEVIAVTGTNGKSSVTHYVAALSETLGTPAGVVGTLGAGRLGALADTGLTTPGTLELQAALGRMARQGVRRVALEASSHALDQQRLDAVSIKAGVFTNLSRDHLDYHGSMAAYAATKAGLFRRGELALAVVNADDALARLMLAGCREGVRVLATGQDEAVTLRVLECSLHAAGLQAIIATPDEEKVLSLGLMGRFNLDNVLLAMAVLYGLGEPLDALIEAAARLQPVPGRMALYRIAGAPSVVVDYAHTPGALESALSALRAHLGSAGQLWCVFGCGGDRDRGKRAPMARAAEAGADRCVVTDDNPRSESPAAIREDIVAGFEDPSAVLDIGERRRAIAEVIARAEVDDVILVAGKGHEAYQEIDGVRHDYLDGDEVERALAARSES